MKRKPSLHLVACVKSKTPGPAPAADLYCSPWFRKARAYVEAQGAPWRILSARHGLVKPDEVLAPYETTLCAMSAPERLAWSARVLDQIAAEGLADEPRIVILAGLSYRRHLAEALGPRLIAPMAGMGIGRQLAWLGARRAEAA